MTCIYQYVTEKYKVAIDAPEIRKPGSGFLPTELSVPDYDMLPDEVAGTTSPVRLDVNFHREVRSGENLTLGLGSASGRYNFIVLRGTDTACTASLRIR